MSDYDNTNRIAVWGNREKKSEKHPDFRGTVNVNGVDYNVSLWKRKEGANPKSPALSGSISEQQVKEEDRSQDPDDIDDLPF